MNTEQVIEMAKRGELAHDQVYSELCKFAEEQRQRGQTSEQAFSYYITKTAEGQKLFAAYKALPNSPFDMNSPDRLPAVQRPVAKADDDSIEWGALVHAYSKRFGVSEMRAVDEMLRTGGGQKLFKRQMRAERAANPEFTNLDMQYLDAVDQQIDENREFHRPALGRCLGGPSVVDREMHQHVARVSRSRAIF